MAKAPKTVEPPSEQELREAIESMQEGAQTIDVENLRDVPKEPPREENKPTTPVPVAIDSEGAFEFRNQIELSASAKFAIAAKIAPEHLRKEGPEAVAAALVFCKQHQLPLSAMGKMAYIRGRVQCYGSLYMALAQRHKDFGEMQVFFLNEAQEQITMANKNLKDDVWACVMRAKKKKDTEWSEFFFTKDEAKKAGLFKNDVYNKYLKDMLYHRTKVRVVDTFYASAVEGIEYYEANLEYDEPKDVGPSLNEKLGLVKPSEDLNGQS